MLTREHLGDIYRPQGPKAIVLGLPWTSGGSQSVTQAVDLSLPIRGIRVVFRGRVTVGTAAFTTVNPEGLLNLISNVFIQGTNARQQGNMTLWNCDLATAFVYQHMFGVRGGAYASVVTAAPAFPFQDVIVPAPTSPFPSAQTAAQAAGAASATNVYFPGTVNTFDFRIICDFPFHPHGNNAFGKEPLTIPQFLVRNEEWKDSLQIQLAFGAQAGAGAIGVLGTSAGTTTVAFSGYAGVGTTPVVDLYSLPVLMGLTLKDQILPGVLSRVATQISGGVLTAAGSNIPLLNQQKQPTPRTLFKQGTATVPNAFTTLNDNNVSTLGIQLGGNRNVRNRVDIFTHKLQQADIYGRDPIQGYTLMDFQEQGNPDSAYPGQDIGDGATFQLVGDVAGLAASAALILQEQILHQPTGELMNY